MAHGITIQNYLAKLKAHTACDPEIHSFFYILKKLLHIYTKFTAAVTSTTKKNIFR